MKPDRPSQTPYIHVIHQYSEPIVSSVSITSLITNTRAQNELGSIKHF